MRVSGNYDLAPEAGLTRIRGPEVRM